MATEQKEQQILELLKQSSAVLICLPEQPTTDAIASGLAMMNVVEKLERKGRVVSSGFNLPQNHSFLPKSDEIYDDLSSLKKFIIDVDLSQTSVEELSYDIEDDKLRIYIQPKDGYFEERDVSVTAGEYSFDLVITIDSPDLDHLGRIYEMNADFFYHTPIINIDHKPTNDNYGQIDLVRVTATSASEVIFEMLEHWGDNILDEYMATSLLAGMISKTKSFRSGSVTPRSLSIASHLIDQGARREEIVKHLYQSKKVSTLKLWGRVLSELESEPNHSIVWSVITQEDFEAAGSSEEVLPDVIDELIINTPDAKNVFIIFERADGKIGAFISTASYIQAKQVFAKFNPEGSAHFIQITANTLSAEQLQDMILENIKKHSGA